MKINYEPPQYAMLHFCFAQVNFYYSRTFDAKCKSLQSDDGMHAELRASDVIVALLNTFTIKRKQSKHIYTFYTVCNRLFTRVLRRFEPSNFDPYSTVEMLFMLHRSDS
jgi:hypothetical protein